MLRYIQTTFSYRFVCRAASDAPGGGDGHESGRVQTVHRRGDDRHYAADGRRLGGVRLHLPRVRVERLESGGATRAGVRQETL